MKSLKDIFLVSASVILMTGGLYAMNNGDGSNDDEDRRGFRLFQPKTGGLAKSHDPSQEPQKLTERTSGDNKGKEDDDIVEDNKDIQKNVKRGSLRENDERIARQVAVAPNWSSVPLEALPTSPPATSSTLSHNDEDDLVSYDSSPTALRLQADIFYKQTTR